MIKTIATIAMAATLIPTAITAVAPKEETQNPPRKGIINEQKRPPRRTPGGRRPVDKLLDSTLSQMGLI